VVRDDASSASSANSVVEAREAIDEAVFAYLPLEEARRRLELEENDLPGNEGVGDTGGQEGPRFTRLRRRAAWVHEAAATFRQWQQGIVVEPRAGGVKASFQGIRDWLAELYGNEVELVGGQRVELGDADEKWFHEGLRRTDVLLQVTVNGGTDYLNVSLGILARLVCFFTFRPRDRTTLMLARGKAMQYAKELGLPPELTAQVLVGSIALGVIRTVDETAVRRALLVATGQAFDEEPTSLLGLVNYMFEPDATSNPWYEDAEQPNRKFAARVSYGVVKAVEWYVPPVVSWGIGKLYKRSGQ
jgi:hypothetical protein